MRARHWGQRKPLWSLQNEGWWKHTGPHSESSCKGRNLFVLRLVTPFTQLVSTSSWARNSFPASCQHRGYGKKGPLGFWVVSDRGSSWFTRDDWDKTEPGPRMERRAKQPVPWEPGKARQGGCLSTCSVQLGLPWGAALVEPAQTSGSDLLWGLRGPDSLGSGPVWQGAAAP